VAFLSFDTIKNLALARQLAQRLGGSLYVVKAGLGELDALLHETQLFSSI